MMLISPDTWCERLQGKLMAGLDAAVAMMEGSDDPVVMRKAREKARVCAQMATTARKIVLMTGAKRPLAASAAQVDDIGRAARRGEDADNAFAGAFQPRPERGIDRLKGGGRGRL